jgi:hypothetical protein
VPHVFAYLDAGTGSMLIQAVIAGLVAAPIIFRRQVSNAARALRRLTGSHPETDETAETSASPSTASTTTATTETPTH